MRDPEALQRSRAAFDRLIGRNRESSRLSRLTAAL
jgi:hypothetical protein